MHRSLFRASKISNFFLSSVLIKKKMYFFLLFEYFSITVSPIYFLKELRLLFPIVHLDKTILSMKLPHTLNTKERINYPEKECNCYSRQSTFLSSFLIKNGHFAKENLFKNYSWRGETENTLFQMKSLKKPLKNVFIGRIRSCDISMLVCV